MDLIKQNFGLTVPAIDEEELRKWLHERISYMLDHETDLLLSTLYRLDIDEHKIKEVLQNHIQIPVNEGLTELVLERQRQRYATKQSYRVDQSTFYWGEEE